jgi:hypothetical protein
MEFVLEGEMRFDSGANSVDQNILLDEKRNFIRSEQPGPKILYSHNRFPGHTQNSGACLPGEQKYVEDGLVLANKEIKDDLESFGEMLENSIVIIAGDHGPYLTANCTSLKKYPKNQITQLMIQDRSSAFFSIHWPPSLTYRPNIELIQDGIPAILASLSGEGETLFKQMVWPRRTESGLYNGVEVVDGVIIGGPDNGKSLFENYGLIPNY